MFSDDQYQLLDFGSGTKVERLGSMVVSRQSPSVPDSLPRKPIQTWSPDLTWHREADNNQWLGDQSATENWTVQHQKTFFKLKPTPTGQVGVFPEQAKNWDWIASLPTAVGELKAINLFGYTGGSTMALAQKGCAVSHIDSAKSVVTWAKANANLSGLSECPIRWIAEDATTFVEREIKRGNAYDIFVADPPSFGRGPKGEVWKLERDLSGLLHNAKQLCGGTPKVFLLSCHTPSFNLRRLRELVEEVFSIKKKDLEALELSLTSSDNRMLPSGVCVRWALDR
jgi:23S rRNA (cytosine1962-C5)-methyltransferase